MHRSGGFITLNMTTYSLFAVLAGLTLLMATNHLSPGCGGAFLRSSRPVVQTCDYVEVAKAANSGPGTRPFDSDLGFNVFDQGSSLLVQQSYPVDAFVHASAVRIDKRSCRPCDVIFYGHLPPPMDNRDAPRGKLIQTVPPEDLDKAERLRREYEIAGEPFTLDHGSPSELD